MRASGGGGGGESGVGNKHRKQLKACKQKHSAYDRKPSDNFSGLFRQENDTYLGLVVW